MKLELGSVGVLVGVGVLLVRCRNDDPLALGVLLVRFRNDEPSAFRPRELRVSQKFPWWSSVHETHRWVGE